MENKRGKKLVLVFVLIVIVLAVISIPLYLDSRGNQLQAECSQDSDCVPALCCHASECVAAGNAPDCSDVACTASCESILDCGQGYCSCNAGKCEASTEKQSQLANPASVYCEEQGGELEIREDEQGGQYGVCTFPEGECEEWAFYRGECSP